MNSRKIKSAVLLLVAGAMALALVACCMQGPSDVAVPVAVLTAPIGGEVWGGTRAITWKTTAASPGTVEIRLSSNSGASYDRVVVIGAPDTGSYAWDTTGLPDGSKYRIRLAVIDDIGTRGFPVESPEDFSLDNTRPAVTLTAPVGGEAWSGTRDITWTTDDANRGTVDILYSADSGANYIATVATGVEDTGKYAWDTSALATWDRYRIRILATDKAGNTTDPVDSSADFSVDNAPKVTGVARYYDENRNGRADAGDRLVVPFDRAVQVKNASLRDFQMPVAGDSLGEMSAIVTTGPGAAEVTITLGAAPIFEPRGVFDPAVVQAGSPSGIDVQRSGIPDTIESVETGVDAQPSKPIDIVPAFVESAVSLGGEETFAIVLADVDADTDLDIVTGNDGEANRVWLNDGSGDFADSGQSLGSHATRALAVGDLDGDGDLDLVEGIRTNQPDRVWLSQGAAQGGTTGTFADSGQLLGAYDTRAVVLVDLDGDTDLDLVTGHFSGQPNRVWWNDGTGHFTDSGQQLGNASTSAIAMADVDSDDDLDLVTGNHRAANRVWINMGGGVFADSEQLLGFNSTGGVALGRLDADLDLDMVTGNYEGQANRVWRNNTIGTFTDTGQALGSDDTLGIVLVDVDGDGDLDLATANRGTANRVWLNDGLGSFFDSGERLGTSETTCVAAGDVDGDGDPDLVFGNANHQPNRIYLDSLSVE